MTLHFKLDKFFVISLCCEMAEIKLLKRRDSDSREDWDKAIECATFLVNNRYVQIQEVSSVASMWSLTPYAKRQEIEDDISLIALTDLTNCDEKECSVKTLSCLDSSEFKHIGELANSAKEQYQILTDKLYELQEQTIKINDIFEKLVKLVDFVQNASNDPQKCKDIKNILEDICIPITPIYEKHEIDPHKLLEKELLYYKIVFPELFHSWRGTLITQSFGI